MATRAAAKNKKKAPVQALRPDGKPFPDGPYSGHAGAIRDEEKRILEQKRLERLKAQQMTHPHLAVNMQGRADVLAIPEEARERLRKLGLQCGWVQKDEVRDYLARGYALATTDQIGELRHDYLDDASAPPTTIVERRDDIVLVVYPIDWEKDRMLIEGHADQRQRDVDPNVTAGGRGRRGQFGKGARRQPQGLFEDEETEDEHFDDDE